MHNSPNLSSIALTAILKQQSQPSRPSTKPTVSDCVGVTRGYPYASHFAARPASSARVYTSTILAVFQRPCAMISCVGAPAAAIRLAMPTRPEWPEKPDPSPAVADAARDRGRGQPEDRVRPDRIFARASSAARRRAASAPRAAGPSRGRRARQRLFVRSTRAGAVAAAFHLRLFPTAR